MDTGKSRQWETVTVGVPSSKVVHDAVIDMVTCFKPNLVMASFFILIQYVYIYIYRVFSAIWWFMLAVTTVELVILHTARVQSQPMNDRTARKQAVTWVNVESDPCWYIASLDHIYKAIFMSNVFVMRFRLISGITAVWKLLTVSNSYCGCFAAEPQDLPLRWHFVPNNVRHAYQIWFVRHSPVSDLYSNS